jgi:hypothetical protein
MNTRLTLGLRSPRRLVRSMRADEQQLRRKMEGAGAPNFCRAAVATASSGQRSVSVCFASCSWPRQLPRWPGAPAPNPRRRRSSGLTMPSARATVPSKAQTTTCNADWLSIFRRPMLSELRSRSPAGAKHHCMRFVAAGDGHAAWAERRIICRKREPRPLKSDHLPIRPTLRREPAFGRHKRRSRI